MSRMLLLALIAGMVPAAQSQTLASLVDKNRVLLVLAPTDQDGRYQEQVRLLRHHTAAMKERDLVLLPVLLQPSPPATANTLRFLHPPVISDEEQLTTRRRFRVAAREFAVVLVGKDGGEKLRSAGPLTMELLKRTIDAMPMRQEEMRQREQR